MVLDPFASRHSAPARLVLCMCSRGGVESERERERERDREGERERHREGDRGEEEGEKDSEGGWKGRKRNSSVKAGCPVRRLKFNFPSPNSAWRHVASGELILAIV